jgi:prevent-host-death family protein
MLNKSWQLQEAKNKFSYLVDLARSTGPQIVTRHGKEVAVLISISEYKKLIKPNTNLLEFFLKSPLTGIDLEIDRKKERPRDIEL